MKPLAGYLDHRTFLQSHNRTPTTAEYSIFYPAHHLQEEGTDRGASQTQRITQAMPVPKRQIHRAHCQGALLNLAEKGNRHFQRALRLTLTAAYSGAAATSQCQALAGSSCGVLYSPVSVLRALPSFINFKQNGEDVNSLLGICQCLLNMLYIPLLILYWMVDVISLWGKIRDSEKSFPQQGSSGEGEVISLGVCFEGFACFHGFHGNLCFHEQAVSVPWPTGLKRLIILM